MTDYDDDWGCLCGTAECPDCGPPCTWCGGEQWGECDDPLAGCGAGCTGDYCPCRACDGTGLRAFQRVF